LTGNILGASAMLSIIMTIFLLPRLFSLLGKKASLICCQYFDYPLRSDTNGQLDTPCCALLTD
jgi:hypothetical protein